MNFDRSDLFVIWMLPSSDDEPEEAVVGRSSCADILLAAIRRLAAIRKANVFGSRAANDTSSSVARLVERRLVVSLGIPPAYLLSNMGVGNYFQTVNITRLPKDFSKRAGIIHRCNGEGIRSRIDLMPLSPAFAKICDLGTLGPFF